MPTKREVEEVKERIRREEDAQRVDLDNHEGIKQLKELREAEKQQRRLEEQQREEERQQALQAQAAEELRATKSRMKEKYVRAGGDPIDFETTAWPALRNKLLEDHALAVDDNFYVPGTHF